MERDARILERLAARLTIQEVALGEGMSPRRAAPGSGSRAFLAREAAGHPGEFVQMRTSASRAKRCFVAYSAISSSNLEAVDRVVKIVRELDHYHGFALLGPPAPISRRSSRPLSPPHNDAAER